jgi:hypothetical protein
VCQSVGDDDDGGRELKESRRMTLKFFLKNNLHVFKDQLINTQKNLNINHLEWRRRCKVHSHKSPFVSTFLGKILLQFSRRDPR